MQRVISLIFKITAKKNSDIGWVNDFIWYMSVFSDGNSMIDGFTWHGYPLKAGKDPKIAKYIMDPNFGNKIKETGDTLKLAYWAQFLKVKHTSFSFEATPLEEVVGSPKKIFNFTLRNLRT